MVCSTITIKNAQAAALKLPQSEPVLPKLTLGDEIIWNPGQGSCGVWLHASALPKAIVNHSNPVVWHQRKQHSQLLPQLRNELVALHHLKKTFRSAR